MGNTTMSDEYTNLRDIVRDAGNIASAIMWIIVMIMGAAIIVML